MEDFQEQTALQHLDNVKSNKILTKLKYHALTQPEQEVAGFIVFKNNEYFFVDAVNEAAEVEKETFVVVGGLQYARALKKGEVVAFFHSHVSDYDEKPSEFDKQSSQLFNLPFVIFLI